MNTAELDDPAISPAASSSSPVALSVEHVTERFGSGQSEPVAVDDLSCDVAPGEFVADGNDVPSMRNQTVRVNVGHAAALETRRPVVDRFIAAFRKTARWMYDSPDAAGVYAASAAVPESVVPRPRSEFLPGGAIIAQRITGIDSLMADAVRFKFIQAPLTETQLARLFSNTASNR